MSTLTISSNGLSSSMGANQVKKKIRPQSLLVVGFSYLFLLITAISMGGFGVVLSLYVILSVFAGKMLLDKDIAISSQDDSRFKKTLPLKKHGISLADFEYLYFYSDDILAELRDEINDRIRNSSIFPELRPVYFTDCDRRLLEPERRDFYSSSASGTRHGTEIALVLYTQTQGDAQFVHWWVLARGFIDPDRVFSLLAYAPLLLPFWIFSSWRNELDLVSASRNIYDSFYAKLDYTSLARYLHFVAFEALVKVLDNHEIDTSDLKVQRAQVMNFNVSGGQARFGNVVQAFKNATTTTKSTPNR
jgi:hypothetical protein